jgi:hypothetical protein
MSAKGGTLGGGDVSKLIDRLSSIDELGVFVGAGISIEAGLPSWGQLVRKLLREIAPEMEPFRIRAVNAEDDEEELERLKDEFASKTIASLGLPGAAAVTKQHLGIEYGSAVKRILYASVEEPSPGPTAMAIARLILGCKPELRVPVLTTNFDVLIELALEATLRDKGVEDPEKMVRAVEPDANPEEGKIDVVHMHGVLPHPGSSREATEIIFSEDEFLVPHPHVEKAREILGQRPHLFLGTSLTDTNVLGHLYRNAEEDKSQPHAAVAVSQQAASDVDPEAAKVVVDALQSSGATRLKKADVEVAFVDTYSEASQFVEELILQRSALGAGGTDRYAEASWCWHRRAEDFEQSAMAGGLLPALDREKTFKRLQKKLGKLLDHATKKVSNGFADEPALGAEGEQLALHLWIHAPLENLLWLIAQADRRLYNPATLQVHPSTLPTKRLVVEALCNGTVVEARGENLKSERWGSMIAVPFTASEEVAGGWRAPISAGVMVLASTNAADAGLVRLQARPKDRAALVAAISRLGREIVENVVAAAPPRDSRKPQLELLDDEGFPRRGSAVLEDGVQRIGPKTHVGGAPATGLDLGKWGRVIPSDLADRLRIS